MRRGLTTAVLLTMTLAVRLGAASPQSQPVADSNSVSACSIRVAVSQDGERFTDTGEVLIAGASRPDLVALSAEELLAIFEQSAAKQRKSTLAVSRSKDGGRTWSAARPVQLDGLPEGVTVGSPSLVLMPSGLVRMYFVVREQADRVRGPAGTFICSAVTRDGVEYGLDRQVRIPCEGLPSAHISAFWAEKQLVLLVTADAEPDARTNSRSAIRQFLSADGRTFTPPDRARIAGEVGHVLRLDQHHWRMYLSSRIEIRSLMSNDGIRWREESGTCLRGGFDPAVARLDRDKFVMLFAAAEPAGHATSMPELAAAHNLQPTGSTESSAEPAEWSSFSSSGYESELGQDLPGAPTGTADADVPLADGEFAPKPDLRTHFDYVEWYRQNLLVPDEANAWQNYDVFLHQMLQHNREEWIDMLNNPNPPARPSPWSPAEHPDWEKSYLLSQAVFDSFRAAANDPRPYSTPPLFSIVGDGEDWSADLAPGKTRKVLWDCLLPGLAWSTMTARSMMAGAWRTENGAVSPEAMYESWQPSLGAARHYNGSPTTVERIVGMRLRGIVEENARWALDEGIFTTPEQIEAAYNALRQGDTPCQTDLKAFRMEHAAGMDLLQNLFLPKTTGGEPRFDMETAVHYFGYDPNSRPDSLREELASVGVQDGYAAIDILDNCYREMEPLVQTGYPSVRAADIYETTRKWVNGSPLAGRLIPSFAQQLQVQARAEASRRATQLAYAVEMFRAGNGRPPSTLDEVAGDDPDIRIDPFTGGYFGYRIEDGRPRIYSLGENGTDDGGTGSGSWALPRSSNIHNSIQPLPTEPGPDDHVFWPPQE